jgi:hypothetical protein
MNCRLVMLRRFPVFFAPLGACLARRLIFTPDMAAYFLSKTPLPT